MSKVIELSSVEPSLVRAEAGFSSGSCWVEPRQQRPRRFKVLHNVPGSEE